MKKTERLGNASPEGKEGIDGFRELGVYVHIPFCRKKCLYCDFPSIADGEQLFSSYTTALCRAIAGRGGILSTCGIDTVYFGGGTPTVLPKECLLRIIGCLRSEGRIVAGAEVSIEANPGTISKENLSALREGGFNRISIGVQAFDDRLLAALGRIHTAADAVRAVEEAAKSGFEDISVDLMYGLPGQSVNMFRASLLQAAALPVRHVSVYGLKLEENTPFFHQQAAGKLDLPDEEQEAAMYDLAVSFLPERGFNRYEISNFAKHGAECRHNIKYWRYEPYLGFGAGAHSFFSGRRWANVADSGEYIRLIFSGEKTEASFEIPEPAVAMAEYVFLALRTVRGLIFEQFRHRFSFDFPDRYVHIAEKLADKGLLRVETDGIRLTDLGMKFGNIVFASFLPEGSDFGLGGQAL